MVMYEAICVQASDAPESSIIADSKNRIAVTRSVTEELKVVEGQQVTVTNVNPTSKRAGNGRYLGAYKIEKILDEDSSAVYLGQKGRQYISDEPNFTVRIRNQVPNNNLTVEEARRLNEFTETLHIEDYSSNILALAYHAGDIEANTDESAWWFYKKCKEYGTAVDVYTARGYGKHNFSRWHIGSSSLHPRSFPKLREVAGRHYDTVVSFHLHDVKGGGSPKILVGGRVDTELREHTADRLDDSLPSKYDYITDRNEHSMMGGGRRNIVNWLARDGGSGLQIEVTPRISQTKRKTVGRQVALSVLEQLGKK
jgi:phage replication-related protein YjqB (UPF0714/DUF867 family)